MKNFSFNGWLFLDKPEGLSSNKALQMVRKLYGYSKAGFVGTLDPIASGFLPIAIGKATKAIKYLENCKKEYEFRVDWSKKTSTGDSEGHIIKFDPCLDVRLECANASKGVYKYCFDFGGEKIAIGIKPEIIPSDFIESAVLFHKNELAEDIFRSKQLELCKFIVPLNPNKIRSRMSNNNKVAIIIGIENYSETPQASYANLDAKFFYEYSKKAFGVKPNNINLLIDEDATVVKTDKALSLWLKSKIKKNRSDLIIFFAGHGLASADGKELYLLPQDGNPDRLERTALSRTDLFREIIELNPKSVTMFLDTCYSGVSRDEQMLLASARPIRIVADEQEGIPDNFTIFSASKLDQISSGLKEVNHGIFSYFLMKGLEGNADSNQDKKITNGELLAYMDDNVSQKAAEQGREQNPSLAGDPDKVLMTYR